MWEIMTLAVICGLSWIAVYLWGRAEGYKETEDILGKELTALKSAYEGNILCKTCSHEYKADTFVEKVPKKRKNRRKLI